PRRDLVGRQLLCCSNGHSNRCRFLPHLQTGHGGKYGWPKPERRHQLMKQTHEVRPAFTLMKLHDAISHFHMQMPRWLFSDPQYSGLSLESKVAYTFLLNRFQLSRRNGWVNRHGEVYVIYTREDLAREMQISYRKAITCFKELVQKHLLWEQRQGRGMPNRIF